MRNTETPSGESRDVPTYDLRGAAQYLGVSHQTIWRWVRDGHLPADRVGIKGMYRIKGDDLDRMVRAA